MKKIVIVCSISLLVGSAFAEEGPPEKPPVKPPAEAATPDAAPSQTTAMLPEHLDHFEKKIRPLLAKRCYECHSAQRGKTKGGLTLDSRPGWQKGSQSGAVIVPGDPDASLLIKVVRRTDPDTAMPPDNALSEDEVRELERWVKIGAPDPRVESIATQRVVSPDDLWSLRPMVVTAPPNVRDGAWPRTVPDRFILAELEKQELQPAGDANAEVFARRLWFTLVGLPPTPEELRAFVAESRRDFDAAVQITTDRLLASQQFGEKWARHWLDVARYAESNGKANNISWPHAWHYRDWVIAAVNADKPYDRFLTEQFAGDLLPATTKQDRDALNVATGFLALGSKETFRGCGRRPMEEVQPDWVDDQINVLGRGILGINIACSRCHDHKFDPVPMRDYYALAGLFFSTEILSSRKWEPSGSDPKRYPLFDPELVLLGDPAAAEILKSLDVTANKLSQQLEPLQNKLRNATDKAEKERLQSEIKPLETQLAALNKEAPPVEWAFGVREADPVGNTKLRLAGAWNKLGEEVPRGFLSAVTAPAAPAIPADASGRLQLAEWLTHPEHPLTTRVHVNRVWQLVFGQGIVTSPENFGYTGDSPSHPELLDFMARRFQNEHGWSLKKLVRELVLSRAFRQASTLADPERTALAIKTDPGNRLLWRMNVRRLDAEAIRDALLAESGLLDPAPRKGTNSALMKLGFAGLYGGRPDELRAIEARVRHRSIYLTVIRNVTLDAVLDAFNFPTPEEPIVRRDATTVPAQSLLLMNNPLAMESARALATLISAETQDEASRVREAFLRVLSREPDADEERQALEFLRSLPDADGSGANPLTPLASLCQSLFLTAEFRLLQ